MITSIAALNDFVAAQKKTCRTIGLVPTMGALHAGHLSLVEASLTQTDTTIVTIFINPTQFSPHEDLENYPKTLERDLQLLAGLKKGNFVDPKLEDHTVERADETLRSGDIAFIGSRRKNH